MKIDKNYIKKIVLEELKKEEFAQKYDNHRQDFSEEILDINNPLSESFEKIESDTILKESEKKLNELKSLNLELKKMKHLVDFRSPLLNND